MHELDLLKKDWNKPNTSFPKVKSEEIYAMIQKKSSSIVRWIFLISIAEFLLWLVLDYFTNDTSLYQQGKDSKIGYFVTTISTLDWIVRMVFIFIFYKNFRKISNTSSVKSLMYNILKIRKIVNNYVWYNVGLVIIIGISAEIAEKSFVGILEDKGILITPLHWIMLIVLSIVFLLIIVGLFWLFYRVLYGILLKRLQANYKKLSEIDI
ncbi:MAG: hypothetical protein Q4B43_03095 [Bacteroidota bacterium]|nr:hypothetical protein [Bacteroidota bacterium]